MIYRDDGAARYNHPCSVGNLPLTVASDARIVPDVFVADVADPQLGAIIEDANSSWRLHRVGILVPEDLRRGSALSLAVENDSISWNKE